MLRVVGGIIFNGKLMVGELGIVERNLYRIWNRECYSIVFDKGYYKMELTHGRMIERV
jgi:hypothetical protein